MRPFLLFSTLAAALSLTAAELPIRIFTTADGLPNNLVQSIVRDSRGLLWICARGGISRFDGSNFQNFGFAEGIPAATINGLLEMPSGDFLLATNSDGVTRFSLAAGRRPQTFRVAAQAAANRVNGLRRTPQGEVFASTDGGLYRVTERPGGEPSFSPVPMHVPGHPEMFYTWTTLGTPDGSLWVASRHGLIRVLPGNRSIFYPVREGWETDNVMSLFYSASDDLLWIGHEFGVVVFRPPPLSSYGPRDGAGEAIVDRSIAREFSAKRPHILDATPALPVKAGAVACFDTTAATASPHVVDIQGSAGGVVRVVLEGLVIELSGGRFVPLGDSRFRSFSFSSASDDREGNLWLATRNGAVRVARRGFVTFREADGLGRSVGSVFENRAGQVIAYSDGWRISRFNGTTFETVRVNVPESVRLAGWRYDERVLEDHTGDWWFATRAGLLRFTGVRRLEDLATITPRVYTTRDGLTPGGNVRIFEDSRGDLWISPWIPGREVLTRWERSSGRFQRYSDADGLPPSNAVTSFYEDPRGALWFSFRDGGLARYQAGRFSLLTASEGAPPGNISTIRADHAGRLWCSSDRGLYRIDNSETLPMLGRSVATTMDFSGAVMSFSVETSRHEIYAITTRGIFRIAAEAGSSASSPATSVYTTSEGLAGSEVLSAFADSHGKMWFGTAQGLSYYEPEESADPGPPEVRIAGVRIAGVAQALSAAGEQSLSGLELLPGQSQLEIDLMGISFVTGEALTFQQRLVGGDTKWSSPSPSRSVLFSNLAPGSYRFEVRAISAGGRPSPNTATVDFRVLPPVWRSWWFLAMASTFLFGAVAAFEGYRTVARRKLRAAEEKAQRAREERFAELERVRKRIAADLHDEIGSSLTQISILSEVAFRHGADSSPELRRPLSAIAESSRELVDAMSDIVWAINPAKDSLSDLTQRMRRLASDAFTASNTAFHLELPPPEAELRLGANLRRELFLIFKEAVHNIVKHSGCTEVTIRLELLANELHLEIRDNGRGFDLSQPSDGHGLTSLRERAAALGTTCHIASSSGAGTKIALDLPIPT